RDLQPGGLGHLRRAGDRHHDRPLRTPGDELNIFATELRAMARLGSDGDRDVSTLKEGLWDVRRHLMGRLVWRLGRMRVERTRLRLGRWLGCRGPRCGGWSASMEGCDYVNVNNDRML